MNKHLPVLLIATAIMATSFSGLHSAFAKEVIGKKKTTILKQSPIKVFETDSAGKGLDTRLGFKATERISKGTTCFHCTGTPRKCTQIQCDEIVIYKTPD